jgi:hypothetical protein
MRRDPEEDVEPIGTREHFFAAATAAARVTAVAAAKKC